MSGMLFGAKPIVVSAEMVALFGPLDAIVIQQVHYWARVDGWAVGSYERWARTTGLSQSQVHRALKRLRETGMLDAEHVGQDRRDRTLAYRVGEAAIREMQRAESRDAPRDVARTHRAESRDVLSVEREQEMNEGDNTHAHSVSVPVLSSPSLSLNVTVPSMGEAFDQFWLVYPRRVGKRKAQVAFEHARNRAPVSDIVAGAVMLAADPNLPETQFIPHPTTWLNRDGWNDEPMPTRDGKSTRPVGAGFVSNTERLMKRAEGLK
jgi:DNA-binding transcriptional ArsR family regulator